MSVAELRVELPETLSVDEARMLLAVKLYEVGRVTLGQASKIADLSKQAFLETLGRYKVPVFNYSPDDLRRELED